ncbi:MAG: biotin transporter BioY [Lachnospiraceae bacterium]|nr:biotin transporter BioY [Lachnospiraceae bacterium]
MAMFAAILSVSAYISIPLPFPGAPHITLQNFCILLIALLFPWDQALLIACVWMLLGIVGVPVFIGGKAGIGYLASNPWGGYTLAFLPVIVLMAILRGREYRRVRYTIISVLGALLIDALGMVYLRFYPQSGYNWTMAVTAGFFAFLPLDLIKAAVAAQVVPAFLKLKGAAGVQRSRQKN